MPTVLTVINKVKHSGGDGGEQEGGYQRCLCSSMGNSPVQAARPDPAPPRQLRSLPRCTFIILIFLSLLPRGRLFENSFAHWCIFYSLSSSLYVCVPSPSPLSLRLRHSPPPPPPALGRVEHDGLIPVEYDVSTFLITAVNILCVFGKSLCLLLLCLQNKWLPREAAWNKASYQRLPSSRLPRANEQTHQHEWRRHAVSYRCFFRFRALLLLNRISLLALVPLCRSTTDCISVSKAATFITTKYQQISRIYSALLDWKLISHRLLKHKDIQTLDVSCCCRLRPVMSRTVPQMFWGFLKSIWCLGISTFNACFDYFLKPTAGRAAALWWRSHIKSKTWSQHFATELQTLDICVTG